ncbi:LPS assembly lipoprotein LptE [Rubritepida flocculans]|uniref:LPS assembly lipoprotein LptE n=1 Tax=Rubritepida flocculans TaxID=182403 RepID=UPI0004245379|nr:LPS assembly lipoprotein LptE [Rubritepida flocculans]
MWRRAFLLGALAPLGGCGFRPLYGPDGERRPAETPSEPRLVREMAAVRVAEIPERVGQLLRRQLQRSFEDRLPGTPQRYTLIASLGYTVEVLGIRRDGLPTRVRYIATGTWALTDTAAPPSLIGRGEVRTLDSYNIPDVQLFAAEVSRDDMERRIVQELGERITLAVAARLRQRLAAQG